MYSMDMCTCNYGIHITEEAVDKAQVQTGLHPKSLPTSIRFENRTVHWIATRD